MTEKFTLEQMIDVANYQEENEWDCVNVFKPRAQAVIHQLLADRASREVRYD